MSRSTLQRIFKRIGITKWRAKKRPKLTTTVARLRLQFARDPSWRTHDWEGPFSAPNPVIKFSDECSVIRGKSGKQVWVFRTPKQKWDKEMIEEKERGKGMAQMFWGAIWVGGRSKLIVMERDEGAARRGYSSISYQTTLEEGLLPNWDKDIDLFMQDNASIHKSGSTRDWLDANKVETLLNLPPYPPDLNPIEHLWWKLKKTITELHPDLRDDGWGEDSRERFCHAAVEAWDAIAQDWIDNIILSMPHRLEAVRKARGWHTKY